MFKIDKSITSLLLRSSSDLDRVKNTIDVTNKILVGASRHGSLFEQPFKRKIIENEWYLKQVILYVHNNPVHHRFL